nr:MAG TPA: hypothetical protein [Caudoviricetes sp.]
MSAHVRTRVTGSTRFVKGRRRKNEKYFFKAVPTR